MLSRLPFIRTRAAQVLGVFIVGAAIGAVSIAIFGQAGTRRVIVRQPYVDTVKRHSITTTRPPAQPPAHTTARGARPPALLVDSRARASFAVLQRQLAGAVGLAIAPLGGGPIETFGQAQVAPAWSTSKVPVLVTLLYGYERRGKTLDPQEHAYAAAALEQSDNASIEALFGELESIHGGLAPASAAVQQILRRAGDVTTTVNTAPNTEGFTTYGQTEWSLRNEVTFYRALARGCLLDPRDTSYVLGLMRSVIPSERWGAGSAGYPASVPLAFKGGWGPENGRYQVRQTAIVGSGSRGYVVSMLALPVSGSFDDGTATITALASWARQHIQLNASGRASGCPAAP